MIREDGSWSNDRHISFDDVDKLRQFVDTCHSNEPSDGGNARIAFFGIYAGARMFGADDHRTELVHFEYLAVFSDPILLENNLAFRGRFD